MEGVKKKIFTTIIGIAASGCIYGLLFLLFAPALRTQETALEEKRARLEQFRGLLSKKDVFESEWEIKKQFLPGNDRPDEILNLLVKGLLDYALSQSLVYNKLEPQGTHEKDGHAQIRLYLSFDGDVRKLAAFIHHLWEKEPSTRIESFIMKQDGNAKNFLYELTLGKTLK